MPWTPGTTRSRYERVGFSPEVRANRSFQGRVRPRDTQNRWLANAVPLRHGTTAGYNRRCRCWDCREAWAAYMRDYRWRTHITTDRPWGAMYERTYRARDERIAQANAENEPEPIFPDPHADPPW